VGCLLLSVAAMGCGSASPSPISFPFGGDVRQIVGAKWNEENGILNEHDGWTLHPIQATVTFPSGRQFSTFSASWIGTQRRGRLVELNLYPNRQPLEFEQAVELVESLTKEMEITNLEHYQQVVHEWKTKPRTKSDIFPRPCLVIPEDDVEVFIKIRSDIDRPTWFVTINLCVKSAFARTNDK